MSVTACLKIAGGKERQHNKVGHKGMDCYVKTARGLWITQEDG